MTYTTEYSMKPRRVKSQCRRERGRAHHGIQESTGSVEIAPREFMSALASSPMLATATAPAFLGLGEQDDHRWRQERDNDESDCQSVGRQEIIDTARRLPRFHPQSMEDVGNSIDR